MQQKEFAGLTCRVVEFGESDSPVPDAVVVLCHGFGAPGTDLVPLASEIAPLLPQGRKVRFYFPEGPLQLDSIGLPGGRAWWWIDMERLAGIAQQRDVEKLHASVPEGLGEMRQTVAEFVEAVRADTGLDDKQWPQRLVIGGFSQGSMLATDHVLQSAKPPAGLTIFSGALTSQEEWSKRAGALSPVNVLQTHGRQDPILPFESAEALKDLLEQSGHEVEFLPFDGGHTISGSGLRRFGERVAAVAGT